MSDAKHLLMKGAMYTSLYFSYCKVTFYKSVRYVNNDVTYTNYCLSSSDVVIAFNMQQKWPEIRVIFPPFHDAILKGLFREALYNVL